MSKKQKPEDITLHKYSDNYHHRKCFFDRKQVPTQTVMKYIMSEPLAMVYFKSMNYDLKVMAGLEPPLKGGGSEWFQPPQEQLAGRPVLQPIDLKTLKWLSTGGLEVYGRRVRERHYQSLIEEKIRILEDNENDWKLKILEGSRNHYVMREAIEADINTEKLMVALEQFERMYRTYLTKTSDLVMESAETEIKRIRKEAYDHMCERLETLLHCQATRMYQEYEDKFNNEKAALKAKFIEDVNNVRTHMSTRIHDINLEKHKAVEKLRHYLECQKLACQIYVALKEKEEGAIEIELREHEHKKEIKILKDEIKLKELEIHRELEKREQQLEFERIWKKKICQIVKKFQMFVSYCLKLLPEQADFFLNMEALMMLQLEEAVNNPNAESSFEDSQRVSTPVPRPHPFYLFCDKGFKPDFDPKLCPKKCTSSASQLPVIVINDRYIYASCDNFKNLPIEIEQYIHGELGDNIEDHHKYLGVPVTYTSSTRIKELKLESSLMQILQEEYANVRDLDIWCKFCKIPFCFCCSPTPSSKKKVQNQVSSAKIKDVEVELKPGNKLTRISELKMQREPKWESYFDFVQPKKCKCASTAKKYLSEHLPPYMKNVSPYVPPEMPNYETCTLESFKRLVKKASGYRSPPPAPKELPCKYKDTSTQYEDPELEYLCTCFSEDQFNEFLETLKADHASKSKICDADGGILPTGSFMKKPVETFALERAVSLRQLLDDDIQMTEIFFKRPDCKKYEKKTNEDETVSSSSN